MVGVTAAEAENPKVVIPKAINGIPVRIMLFYIGALAVIMCIYPWSRLSPSNSPFVLVFRDIGLPGAASIVNFVVITAAASACNSSLYTTGRMLAELTSTAHRPVIRKISRLSKRSVPATAVIISAVVIGIAAILNLVMPEGVFTFVSSIAPFTDYVILVFLFIVLIVLCMEKQTLIALILTLAWFAILAVASLTQKKA